MEKEMIAAKHTPGPWRAYRRADYTTPGWVVLWPDTSKPGIHHRRLDSNGGFTEADASLIAAAPDLLEAVQAMLIPIDEYGCGFASSREDFWDGVDKARAAIAKATGGPA